MGRTKTEPNRIFTLLNNKMPHDKASTDIINIDDNDVSDNLRYCPEITPDCKCACIA